MNNGLTDQDENQQQQWVGAQFKNNIIYNIYRFSSVKV